VAIYLSGYKYLKIHLYDTKTSQCDVKVTEIAVDLLSKIIKYSSALKEAGDKIPD